ncbi:uncharacterized protein LOC122856283 [Aphidius gifuensis]|uniref:uncharacterized protein LOC122856283 n=1 Tax=Aphidius gifuensis TaxID=684658 RepID=UPI001CDCE600|nr:uncharacterized protein LOC122856283 [Aphidius gifuensis]
MPIIISVYPYNIEGGSLLWVLHWIWETLCQFAFVQVGCTSDNLFGYYAINIVAQFRVLSYEIEYTNTDNYDEKQKYINGPIVLAMTVSTALILCTLIFQVNQMENITMGQMAFLAVYIWYKLMQAFLYAWAGEEIKIANEALRMAVYNSNWENNNTKLNSTYINMLLNQKCISIRACGLVEISAELFAKIINTTMSYFFLLQTINQE